MRKSKDVQLAADRLKIITHLVGQAAHKVADLACAAKQGVRGQLFEVNRPNIGLFRSAARIKKRNLSQPKHLTSIFGLEPVARGNSGFARLQTLPRAQKLLTVFGMNSLQPKRRILLEVMFAKT